MLFLKKISALLPLIRQAQFRLDEIDLSEKQVVVFCRGTRTFVRASLAEVIFDNAIIFNLPSSQSCFIGYYGKLYGVAISNEDKSFLRHNEKGFLLRFIKGRFKIVSQDRDGSLTYLDTRSKKIFVESPFAIAQQESIISQFDPSQACYIGVLAGISAAKQRTKIEDLKPRKVVLRLVQ